MKRNFPKGSQVDGLIWFILGIGLCIGSLQLNLGRISFPGPGLLPFLCGSTLVLLGLILIFSGIEKRLREEKPVKVDEILLQGKWKTILLTILALIVYVILFEYVGFFFTTFFFLFFLFKLTAPKKWLMPFVLSSGTVVLGYFIFSVWLRGQFPRGIFNF
jgi:uncharacterized membrane protein YidH (DUF202 family)